MKTTYKEFTVYYEMLGTSCCIVNKMYKGAELVYDSINQIGMSEYKQTVKEFEASKEPAQTKHATQEAKKAYAQHLEANDFQQKRDV